MYAKNITTQMWNPRKNKGIAKLCQDAYTAENNRRAGGVHFIHVKGHSKDKGNDKADERVQWGKDSGPYCRFRSDGSSQGDYINSPLPSPMESPGDGGNDELDNVIRIEVTTILMPSWATRVAIEKV